MSATTDWPIAIRTVDLARPLHPLTGVSTYSRVRVFISDGPTLLGSVDMWSRGAPTISTTRLGDAIAARVAAPLYTRRLIDRLIAAERPAAVMPATRVSIIVPTCDRPDDLRRCLASLVAQRTRHDVEIVVVDNRPSCDAARSVAGQFPSVRLVTESRPGLSFARNTGIVDRETGGAVCAAGSHGGDRARPAARARDGGAVPFRGVRRPR